MSNWYILDENNNPILSEARIVGRWMEENKQKRIIALTEFDDICLSTVFLCLDHDFLDHKPILYESLWFEGVFDGKMQRYSTREEAIVGHKEMLCEYIVEVIKNVPPGLDEQPSILVDWLEENGHEKFANLIREI